MANDEEKFGDEVEEYLEILERLNYFDADVSDYRNRQHRRFIFDTPEKTILVRIGEVIGSLYDVSLGGLSFFAAHQFNPRQRLTINFDDRYECEIVIVGSRVDAEASSATTTLYRHGAQFVKESDGYRCTLTVLRYYLEIMKSGF